MKSAPRGVKYALRHRLSHRRVPLICSLVLTNQCNIRRQHCRVATCGDWHLSFREITDVVGSYYREDGRCLYLQMGEPFLRSDGRHRIDDVVEYAHDIGFFIVVIACRDAWQTASANCACELEVLCAGCGQVRLPVTPVRVNPDDVTEPPLLLLRR